MATMTLEEVSLWYGLKAAIWPLAKNDAAASEPAVVIHNIMRILRAFRNVKDLAYVSAPITSGRELYEMLSRPGAPDRATCLKQAIAINYEVGRGFVEELAQTLGFPILYPADMVATHQDWEQDHYQCLWLSVIAELCTELRMCPGWEFSNGCCEEFTHAMQLRLGIPQHPELFFVNTKGDEAVERQRMRNIRVYDCEGEEISMEQGNRMIEEATAWVRGKGFDTTRLDRCLSLLRKTDEMLKSGFYQ